MYNNKRRANKKILANFPSQNTNMRECFIWQTSFKPAYATLLYVVEPGFLT